MRVSSIGVIAAVLLAQPALAGAVEPPYRTETVKIAVLDGPGSTERITIDATVYVPKRAGPNDPVPAVIGAHGFGGNKSELKSWAVALAGQGYEVLLYSARGFGATGGTIGLAGPDYDVADVAQLIDWLAARPEVEKQGPADPRVGMFGVSYGGGATLMASAFDHRIDAVVPIVAWNSLATAFNPGDVFKQSWASVFFGATARAENPCGRFSLEICRAFTETATLGRLTPGAKALLLRSSPATVAQNLTAPALLIQGQTDTLFPLNEAVATANAMMANGAPVKMVWIKGGHSAPGVVAESAHTKALVSRWFARWLKHDQRVKTGAAFEWEVEDGKWATASAVPSLNGGGEVFDLTPRASLAPVSGRGRFSSGQSPPVLRGQAALASGGRGGGGMLSFVNPAGGQPAAFSDLPGAGASPLLATVGPLDIPGQSVSFDSAPLTSTLKVVGIPRLRTSLTSTTGEAVVFAKLYDVGPDGSSTLPGGAIAPARLSGAPLAPLAVNMDLAGIAHNFLAGHRIRLVIASTDQAYANLRQPERYTVQPSPGANLSLPVVQPIRAAGKPQSNFSAMAVVALIAAAGAALLFRKVAGRRPKDETAGESIDADPFVLEGLSKHYGEVRAVEDVNLRVRSGEVFGLLGPNGAGKTTALRMALGLVHPSKGTARILGNVMRPSHPVLARVGAVIEGPGFVPHLSGMENLKLWWRAGGRPVSDADFEGALALAGLGEAIDRRVKTYSHGMRQRLALAQALLGKCELLVLDEPTDGLDPQEIREVRNLIIRLAAAGITILISSHLLAEVEQVCSHVAVMVRGKVVASGSVAEIIGPDRTVYIETEQTASLDQAMKVVRSVGGVESAEADGDGFVATLDGARRSELVAALVGAGIAVSTVTQRRRLEEAFVGLVEDEA